MILITLHGLWHHRRMMKRMVRRLAEPCGPNRIRFEYASSHHSIPALHATMMRSPQVIAAAERFLTSETFS